MSLKLKAIFSVDGGTYMLQPKYSQPNSTSTSANPGFSFEMFSFNERSLGPRNSRRGRKQQLWALNPTSFHQSFDDRLRSCEDGALSNSCGNIDEEVSHYWL